MSFVTDALGFTGNDPAQVAPYQASPITTTTGTVTPTGGGGVTTALSPELQQFYNLYLREAMKNMPTEASQDFANQVGQYGQSMFGQAANLDTGAMTNQYYNQVLQGLDPQRQQENVTLGNTLFTQGRSGLGTGYAGGGYVNPEQFSLLKAREQANAGIYLTAQDRARQIQQENLQRSLGFVGLGNELKASGYSLPTSLFGTGVQLGQINNPLIAPSLTGGQYVTGVNQTNAQYKNQAMQGDQAFISGLFSSAIGATNPLGKFSDLFGSTPTANPYRSLPTYESPSSMGYGGNNSYYSG
jgi:hypothetical protein